MKAHEFFEMAKFPLYRWDEERGYIATTKYNNPIAGGSWTEGINYVVLDDANIAYQYSGDNRVNSDWKICNPEELIEIVKMDIKIIN